MRTVADTVVRRRLLAVPGVSQVTPIGGAERQFQVIAHPEALRANGVSLTELLDAVRGASENASAGHLHGGAAGVRAAGGRTGAQRGGDRRQRRRDARARARCWSATSRTCEEGAALKRGEGSRNGKPAVIVGVQKQPGANTIEVTAAARSRARRAAAGAAGGHHDRSADLPSGRLHPGGGQQRDRARCATAAFSSSSSCSCSWPTCAPPRSR